MTNPKRRTVPALMAGALGMGGALAMAAEPTQQELLSQLQELQAKVAAMEAKQQVNTQDVDATVASVLADADHRSQLMQMEGFTAGYNQGKFIIQSADGNFSLNPNFQFQFRHTINYIDSDDDGNDDNDVDDGFEVRRMKFGVQGNMFTPDLEYVFVWGSERDGGSLELKDAFVRYQFADDWAVRAGQYKDPVHHEELTSSKRQLAVDRSLLNEILGGGATDRVQGVHLLYEPQAGGPLRAQIGYHDGVNTDNTPFFDAGGDAGQFITPPDWGISGRVEYMVMGDNWKAYEDFSAMGNDSDILVIGGGLDWSRTTGGDERALYHTIDAQWENSGGLGVYGAYVGVLSDQDDVQPGATDDSLFDWGFLVQAGYMLNEQWEIFGRYDYTDIDDDRVTGSSEDDIHELTVGFNYYVKGHAAKFTVDGFWLPNGTPVGETGIGVFSQSGDDDQFGLRAQFQLLI